MHKKSETPSPRGTERQKRQKTKSKATWPKVDRCDGLSGDKHQGRIQHIWNLSAVVINEDTCSAPRAIVGKLIQGSA